MQLKSFDYFSDTPEVGHGLEALAGTIETLRKSQTDGADSRYSLLVDNGDLLQGSVLDSALTTNSDRYALHPVTEIMNRLGYTAFGLGNHDLDYGLHHLDWFARGLDASILSSNIGFEPQPDWLRRYILHRFDDLCVGIVSALPPETLAACHALRTETVQTSAMIEALQDAVASARADGADVVLCLAHSGLMGDPDENALEHIVQLAGIDAVVGGHTHHLFPAPELSHIPGADVAHGTLHGVPTVMPGYGASHVGCIDLQLSQQANGTWQVVSGTACVEHAAQTGAAAKTVSVPLAHLHETTRQSLNREVARISHPLHSYFARVMPTRKQAVIAAAQSAAIDAVRHGTEWAALPLLSAVSSPRVGGRGGPFNYTNLPAGALKARHIAQLHVYANLIWAVCVTGAQLRDWLEKSASAFHRLSPSADSHGLVDDAFPSFDFDVIHGITCDIDITRAPQFDQKGRRSADGGGRITSLRHNGVDVAHDAQFLVAVNSFRAAGGGKFPGLGPDSAVLRPDLSADEVVQQHLASGAAADFAVPWQFDAACRGIKTWFETGPDAVPYLDDIVHLNPGTAEQRETGFLRIPITL